MKKPRIGLICFVFQSISVRNYMIQKGYVMGIIDAGGIPVLIPVTEDPSRCAEYMDMIDGLLVPGGEDIAPEYYGEDPVPQVNYINRDKDRYDFELIRLAREQKKPIFGICRGFQVLNVAFGGSLYQDIPSQVPGSICHSQSQDLRNVPTHKVTMDENSVLGKILGKEIYTNSFHHQGIKKVGEGLRIVGSTNDGIPEALESEDGLVYAVQWHPEDLYADYPVFKGLFTRLIELASKE